MWDLHVSELNRLSRVAERFLSFSSPHEPELVELDLREVARRLEELASAGFGEVQRIIEEQYAKARGILEEHRSEVEAMAAALLERETVDREEVELIVNGDFSNGAADWYLGAWGGSV